MVVFNRSSSSAFLLSFPIIGAVRFHVIAAGFCLIDIFITSISWVSLLHPIYLLTAFTGKAVAGRVVGV